MVETLCQNSCAFTTRCFRTGNIFATGFRWHREHAIVMCIVRSTVHSASTWKPNDEREHDRLHNSWSWTRFSHVRMMPSSCRSMVVGSHNVLCHDWMSHRKMFSFVIWFSSGSRVTEEVRLPRPSERYHLAEVGRAWNVALWAIIRWGSVYRSSRYIIVTTTAELLQ